MIELVLFYLHLILVIYVFTKYWQESAIKDGILAITVVALIFIIGWSITGTLSNILFFDSWTSLYFNRDTFSFCLLAIPESIFFYFYFFKENKIKENKGNIEATKEKNN